MGIDIGTTLTTREEIVGYWEKHITDSGKRDIKTVSSTNFYLRDMEDNYQDYHKVSMKIITPFCDFKCCSDAGIPFSTCANHSSISAPIVKLSNESIVGFYTTKYRICQSILFGGLEPLKQMNELYHLCQCIREYGIEDDIVIYTGYYPEELNPHDMLLLISLKGIIIKFGRYIPDSESRYDEVLGVNLISNNQFAVKF